MVHNGIIENFETLKRELIEKGYEFTSDTDTEVIAHLLDSAISAGASVLEAVRQCVVQLNGAFALGVTKLVTPPDAKNRTQRPAASCTAFLQVFSCTVDRALAI